MNGVPTAYSDLESLLTNSEDQIQRGYEHLPSFLQKLIKQLPSKVTQSVGPEVLAATAEKHGLHSKYTDHAAHAGIRNDEFDSNCAGARYGCYVERLVIDSPYNQPKGFRHCVELPRDI